MPLVSLIRHYHHIYIITLFIDAQYYDTHRLHSSLGAFNNAHTVGGTGLPGERGRRRVVMPRGASAMVGKVTWCGGVTPAVVMYGGVVCIGGKRYHGNKCSFE